MQLAVAEIQALIAAAMTTNVKKYYIGKVNSPPLNYLPTISVYGISTELVSDQLSTSRDKYLYTIGIDLITSGFAKVSTIGVEADKVLDAQKAVVDLMEERDANGTPKAATVLGTLRRNIQGTNYLFNNDIEITYDFENLVNDTLYMKATLTFSMMTQLTNRS